VTEISGNRDISGLPPPAPPPAAGGLRRFFKAARQAGTEAASAPAPEREDRISLVARATSTVERLARRVKERKLPSLLAGVSRPALATFAQEAIRFDAARPWTRVAGERTIQVDSPRIGEPGFLTVVGDRTAQRGFLVYFQRPGLTMTRQGSLLGPELTWAPFAGVWFWPPSELPPEEAAALQAEGHVTADGLLPYAIFNQGHGYRSPDPDHALRRPGSNELAFLADCLGALPVFIERHGSAEAASEAFPSASGDSGLTLSWVVEGAREL
jgi:hypothetical protein